MQVDFSQIINMYFQNALYDMKPNWQKTLHCVSVADIQLHQTQGEHYSNCNFVAVSKMHKAAKVLQLHIHESHWTEWIDSSKTICVSKMIALIITDQ